MFSMTAILIEASFRREHGYHGVSRRARTTLPRSAQLATREMVATRSGVAMAHLERCLGCCLGAGVPLEER